MGLGQNLKDYMNQGGDKQEILTIADKNGKLNHETVKYPSDLRRDMRRHPDFYSEKELREAGVWNQPATGQYEGDGTVGDVWEEALEEMKARSSRRREKAVSEEEEGDEEDEEDEEDEDDEEEDEED